MSSGEAPSSSSSFAATERWYVLFIMTLVYTLNIADRFVVSTLIEPIEREFALSDAAIGFLTGAALAIFYVSVGIPLGALADRANRRRMISAALAVWSTLTVLCGMAQTFWQLLFARIGVGVGEAGGTPPSQSLLSDKFPPQSRSTVMSIYAVGCSVGAMLGSSAGGWLNDSYGWRNALVLFGLCGLPVSLVVLITVREPQRGTSDVHPRNAQRVTIGEVLRFTWSQKSLVHILAGATVLTFWGWGLIWWTPTFLVRSHHLSVGEAGSLLGPMYGFGGTAVTLFTAWLMQRMSRMDPRLQLWLIASTTLAAVVPSVIVYSTHSLPMARYMLWAFVPSTYMYIGPTLAFVQNLVPAPMRAVSCAILLFVTNIANLLIAPQLIGLASDWLASSLSNSQESLRWVLVAGALTGVWAAYHYFAAARDLQQDLARSGTAA